MTRLILIRHGQSMANVDGVFAGNYDAPLSAHGKKQAAATAEFVVKTYAVDRIYSSDLQRAMYTAQAVAKRLQLPVTPVRGMREIMGGDWEAVKFDQLGEKYPEAYRIWREDLGNAYCPGGETVAAFAERIWQTMDEIALANPDKTVVVATHATPIRVFECRTRGLRLTELQAVPWVSNASVTEAVYEDGRWRLAAVGQDAHLADLRTVLPRNI